MAAALEGRELVHSHTWYANLAGHLGKLLYGIPHVMTAHSLEPLRPWKAEQLGGGYALSSWAERTAIEAADAVIAVSGAMRDDILGCYPALDPAKVHIVHNGIDTALYRPDHGTDALRRIGLDPRPPVRPVRRPHHPAEGRAPSAARGPGHRPGRAGRAVRGRPRHPRDRPGVPRALRGAEPGPRGRALDPADAAAPRGDPTPHPRGRVRLPLGVRAPRHRQPGGDGLRHPRGGLPGRRHPRGRGRRTDRAAGPAWTTSSRPASPGRWTRCSAIRRPRAGWARRDGSARWASSAGTPSPGARSGSTRRSLKQA